MSLRTCESMQIAAQICARFEHVRMIGGRGEDAYVEAIALIPANLEVLDWNSPELDWNSPEAVRQLDTASLMELVYYVTCLLFPDDVARWTVSDGGPGKRG
jgi:hypothetical protein